MAALGLRFDSDVAKRAGVNTSTYANLFKENRKDFPDADMAVKIAGALNTTVEHLVTGENPPIRTTDPILKEICEALEKLKPMELVEMRGYINSYIDRQFAAREATADPSRERQRGTA